MKLDKRYIRWGIEIGALVAVILLLWCVFIPHTAFLPICDCIPFCCSIHEAIFGYNQNCHGYTGGNGSPPGTGDTCQYDSDQGGCIGDCDDEYERCELKYCDIDQVHYCECTPIQGYLPCEQSDWPECKGYCNEISGYHDDCIAETWYEYGVEQHGCTCNWTKIPTSDLNCEYSYPNCDGTCDEDYSCTLGMEPETCMCYPDNPPNNADCTLYCQGLGHLGGMSRWWMMDMVCPDDTTQNDDCCCFDVSDCADYVTAGPSWCCNPDGMDENTASWCMDSTGSMGWDYCSHWAGTWFVQEYYCRPDARCTNGPITCPSTCSMGACD